MVDKGQTHKNIRDEEQPVPSSLYDEAYYGRMALGGYKWFLEHNGVALPDSRKDVERIANVKPGMKMLDLGCGRGEILAYYALHCEADCYGIDYSGTAIELAQQLQGSLDSQVQRRLHFKEGDATDLSSFEDNSFDRVFSLDCVEHLHDWQLERLFTEAHRVLKDDGVLLVLTHPNLNYVKYGYPVVRAFKRLASRKALPADPMGEERAGGHVNLQSPATLARHFRQSGFACKVWLAPRYITEDVPRGWQRAGLFLERVYPLKLLFATVIWGVGAKSRGALQKFVSEIS